MYPCVQQSPSLAAQLHCNRVSSLPDRHVKRFPGLHPAAIVVVVVVIRTTMMMMTAMAIMTMMMTTTMMTMKRTTTNIRMPRVSSISLALTLEDPS